MNNKEKALLEMLLHSDIELSRQRKENKRLYSALNMIKHYISENRVDSVELLINYLLDYKLK